MEGPPGRCQSVPSALARGYPLAQGPGNPAAPDWAGAGSRLPKGRQARMDLTRVKSIKTKDFGQIVQDRRDARDLRRPYRGRTSPGIPHPVSGASRAAAGNGRGGGPARP